MNSKKELKETVLEFLEGTCGVVSPACKGTNISRYTFYAWVKEDKEFADRVKQIQEGAIDFVESSLYEKIKEGDTTAIIFYLKTKGKQRGYSEKQDINFNTDNNLKIEIVKQQPEAVL